MKKQHEILLAFYGDDFTGSTDALEFISRAGAKAMLFIEPPSAELLASLPPLDVIGVAGATRSMTPAEMERILIPAFAQLKTSGAKHIHYKVCSTFDSSPATGNIGTAMDAGEKVFGNDLIPVLGGMPALGRYCAFGNLFARMGIGSNGHVYRLDRHPSMKVHPVTPSDESDLILHLRKQTERKGILIDIVQQKKDVTTWMEYPADKGTFALLDAMHDDDLLRTAQWLEHLASIQAPVFSVGSSGIEMALGKYWNQIGRLTPKTTWRNPGPADPLLVISGSCSPVTAMQIRYAANAGFELLELNAPAIARNESDIQPVIDQAIALLKNKQHVLVHTGSRQGANLPSQKLGTALGRIAKAAAEADCVKRIIISGGDSSSYAARAMEIDAVTMIAPLVSGAPLCEAYSSNPFINGLQVNFKGGQVGPENYFETCINGIN